MFDQTLRIKLIINPHSWPAYLVCGYAGVGIAILLETVILMKLNLSIWILIIIILGDVLTFFSLAMLTKIIAGRESLIYYRYQILILVTTAALLNYLRQPVLPYLDLTIIGIGSVLFCGRIGCLLVGCCHGKPHSFGVRYGKEHVQNGFPIHLMGVRLFPTQALEALFVLMITGTGAVFILSKGYQPGDILTWYIIMYGMGRFFLEFLRGDAERCFLFGFSEAQWTSLILTGLTLWAEKTALLIYHPWHTAAASLIMLTMIAVSIARRFQRIDKYKLLHPDHIREIAESISNTAVNNYNDQAIPVCCTSMGIKISSGKSVSEKKSIYHYSFSGANTQLSGKAAKILYDLIIKLKHPVEAASVIKGNHDVYHMLVAHK